jgi:SAM-dependent methyltransferase
MDLSKLATNIEQDNDGIWFSEAHSAISYPEDGNDLCFELEEGSFWFNHRNRCLVEALSRFPPGGLLFDIGGGNGYVSLAIQHAGWPVVLVEPGDKGCRNAQRRGIHHIICSTLEDAGFAAGSMPAAGAFDVVEHTQDDLEFLRMVAGYLRPGGRLYLSVPAFRGLWSQEDESAGHYRRYTTALLRGVLRATGFQIEYLTYFFRILPIPILLLRAIPYRFGIRRSRAEVVNRGTVDHRAPSGRFSAILQNLLNREVAVIRSGSRMAWGSSCLAVARKT